MISYFDVTDDTMTEVYKLAKNLCDKKVSLKLLLMCTVKQLQLEDSFIRLALQ